MLSPMQGEKIQRAYRRERKLSKKRRKMLTRHHNRAASLGGTYDDWNIYKLSSEHHAAYHKLFGLRTFDEAARVLLRMQELHRSFI
jgi:hypothetical protein